MKHAFRSAVGNRKTAQRAPVSDPRLRRASAAALQSEPLEARVFLSSTAPAAAVPILGASHSIPMVGAANLPKIAPHSAAIGTPAAGYGLLAQYYPSSNFSGTPVNRVDRTVNFMWGRSSPLHGIPGGSFSVRWTGDLVAPRTGTFTFSLTSLGGAHLIINGVDVVNDLGASTKKPTTDTGTVDLVAGQSYSLELDYVATGRAGASLKWSGPKIGKQVLPIRDLLSGVSAPEAPGGLSAQVAAANEVDLSWQDAGSYVTSVKVERSTDRVHFTTIATLAGSASGYADTHVRGNTSYSYRLVESNIVSTSPASSALLVKTVPAGVTPLNVSANVGAGNSVFISWAAPASTANLTGYAIDRSTDGGSTWSNLGTVAIGTNVYTDTTAVDGHSYSYRITAMNGTAAAPFMGTTSATIPLAAPSGLTATLSNQTSVLLQWTNNSASATGFQIDRSPNGGISWAPLATVSASTTSFNTTIAAGQSYAYRVRATLGNSTSTYSNLAAIAASLAAPSNLTAAATAPTSVALNWTVNSSGQTGFEIDRSADGGVTWSTVFFTAANASSYIDSTALGATTYTYRVRAQAGSTNSPYSATTSATTALAAPGNVTATALTTTGVLISWADTNANATGYEVDRSPDGSAGWTALTTTAPNATSYTDSGLSATTTYYYRVITDGPNGATLASPVVSATTAASDAPQYLLTPSVLATMRAAAANNTPQWQAFKSSLDTGLNQVVEELYEGSSTLPPIAAYALGYQILKDTDPTTADAYADKAIGLMRIGLEANVRSLEASRMLLAEADGTTTTFTLPNSQVDGSTLQVWTAPIEVQAVPRDATSADDSVTFYRDFLQVSNTPNGPADYIQGVDWRRNPDQLDNQLEWIAGGNQPANGATYYVTEASPVFGAVPLTSGWTLNGNTLTFATAPAANQAIYVEYLYGTPTNGATTLGYQQTLGYTGGFNNIYIDDTYTSRNLQYIAIGLDWLWSYQGLSTQMRSEATNLLTRWSDFLGTNGYLVNSPSSNYSAGHYAFRVATAIALQGRSADAAQLMTTITAFHNQYILPLFQPPVAGQGGTEAGGFWAEGWSYGSQAIQNILNSDLALEDDGQIDATPDRAWAGTIITTLLEQQPSSTTIYDGGDGYAWPRTFPDNAWNGKLLLEVTAAATTDPTLKSYANWAIQNDPGWTGGWEDMVYRDPSAPASFWGGPNGLPLQYLSSGTGVAVARKDWSYNSTWLSFHAGDYVAADHQSNDQGALTINRGGDPLLVMAPAVGEILNPIERSTYSNLVLIDDGGAGLQTNRNAQGFAYGYGAPDVTMNHFDGTTGFAYMQGNYAAAYDSAPGVGPATELVRDVFYIRGGDYIVTYDRATTAQATFTKQLQWFFTGTPTVTGNSWSVAVGNSKLFGATYSDTPLTTTEASVAAGSATVQQIATNPATPTASVQYLTVMQTAASSVTSEDASTNIDSADGKMEGTQVGNYVVMFGRHGAVAGGTAYAVTAAAGQQITHYVTDLTPGQTYTLAGADQGSATADAQGVLTFTSTGTGGAQSITLT